MTCLFFTKSIDQFSIKIFNFNWNIRRVFKQGIQWQKEKKKNAFHVHKRSRKMYVTSIKVKHFIEKRLGKIKWYIFCERILLCIQRRGVVNDITVRWWRRGPFSFHPWSHFEINFANYYHLSRVSSVSRLKIKRKFKKKWEENFASIFKKIIAVYSVHKKKRGEKELIEGFYKVHKRMNYERQRLISYKAGEKTRYLVHTWSLWR